MREDHAAGAHQAGAEDLVELTQLMQRRGDFHLRRGVARRCFTTREISEGTRTTTAEERSS